MLGKGVAESIGNEILLIDYNKTGISQNAVVITILVSTAIWLILASALGLPISTTHATIGAIMGIGMLLEGIGGVNWITILISFNAFNNEYVVDIISLCWVCCYIWCC